MNPPVARPKKGVDVTSWPDRLAVRSWIPADAQAVAHWRYSGKWSIYDQHDGHDMTDGVRTEAAGYRAVVAADDGRLVGFYCVGGEALVSGVESDDEVIDLGVGMAPAFVGDGRGNAFLQAVLDDLGRELSAKPIRAFIQSWNVRSLSLARRFGFVEAGAHGCVQDGTEVDYTIVVRPVRG
jgi:ribosomal-protein-alanine N-acetyltransferase